MELRFEEITCYETVTGAVNSREESIETAIPEYCPDIARIVDAVGQLSIRERLPAEDRYTVAGAVKVTVLYTSEEAQGLRSLTMSVPFSATVDDARFSGCSAVCFTGRLPLVEARAVTSRKLYLRVLPELTAVGYRGVQRRLCCGVEEDAALRSRQQEVTLPLMTGACEREFSFTEDVLNLPDTPEDLLLWQLCPKIDSCQKVGGKMLVKGEMGLRALYRTEEQSLHTYEGALPFSQIVDTTGLPDEGELTVTPCLLDSELRLMRSEGVGFAVSAVVGLQICVHQEKTVSCLADLYSTAQEAIVKRQNCTCPTDVPGKVLRQELTERLEFGRSQPFAFVTDLSCGAVAVLPEENHTTLRTTVRMKALYLDESGTPVTVERTAEATAVTAEEVGRVGASVCLDAMVTGGGVCELRLGLSFTVGCGAEKTIPIITDVELQDVEETERPSLVLRRMQEDETLWDIAKQYRTDEGEILAANGGEASRDSLLLIPRVR